MLTSRSSQSQSALLHLECTACGVHVDAAELHGVCPRCGKVLFARYALDRLRAALPRDALRGRPPSLWRYFEALPVRDPAHVVTLGEGFTPLLSLPRLAQAFDVRAVYVKDEGLNPTGTFKARGMAVAVSRARELGVRTLVAPSAGNAGAALAAYGARAGLDVHVILPEDTPPGIVAETRAYGVGVQLIRGLIDDAGRLARQLQAEHPGWFDVSTLREPYRVEGKKTLGYELAEQLDWSLPDLIVYPTGGGTGLVGMWKAFAELEALGWVGPARPRMVVVQAEGCAPIVRAFRDGRPTAERWTDASTIAAGLRVPAAIGDYLILKAVRESGGTALAVSDAEILAAMLRFAASGIFASPEGAATLAALPHLRDAGMLDPQSRVVLFNTGSGLKYPEAVGAALALERTVRA
ncbi:MAG: threonine synthase [Armatimonadota bacterium]|nr:threonine synthase [Armatimonadota bacterium]MDR7452993.1 threonine synthase [Armatimonadota bacterium]MDR7457550.1 threonine synthase [Armatimonadota bacterium]MDR7496328.1 threonine synthase [Armatimonadota bacterium]MDR7510534.1 threonine synthase [Armatimonadota bacterium]